MPCVSENSGGQAGKEKTGKRQAGTITRQQAVPGKEQVMIVIDYKDRRPIYEQVVERFQELIVKGVMKPGEQMPSVRSMAMELSINPNTIQRAYAELERRGFTYTIKGRGSFVSVREDFLEYKQKEVLQCFRKDVEDARDLQIEKKTLTEMIDSCYEKGAAE